jgi:uncharacterized protein (UPF0333 family)
MTSIWDKLKEYSLIIAAIFMAIFGGLFFYEKNKNEIDADLLKEQKVDADVTSDEAAIAANNNLIAQQETQRKENDKATTTVPDNVSYLNNKLK